MMSNLPLKHVLDHGFVRLVDHMGDDLSIVRSARVSYAAAWRAGEEKGSDEKLLQYLWKNKHSTPFEAVTFTFEVKLPIFVARQWHRHRTWTYNELSARYRELPTEFYLPHPLSVGQQSPSSKQARVISETPTTTDLVKRHAEVMRLRDTCLSAFEQYQELIASGWPRELARIVLPLNTYTHMFATVNLLNLLKFIQLRDHAHAQYEIQVYAAAMKELVREIVPVTMKAFDSKENVN